MTFGVTETVQKKINVFNISDLLKCKNVWNPKVGGKEGGGGPGGRAGEELESFYFYNPPCSLGPLGCLGVLSSPPVGQEGETSLPRHPAIRQHLFHQERMVHQNEKIKFAKKCYQWPPVFN